MPFFFGGGARANGGRLGSCLIELEVMFGCGKEQSAQTRLNQATKKRKKKRKYDG